MNNVALTTFDNPYNPFSQFAQWLLFDSEKGYNTCAYLGRIAQTSEMLTDEENEEEIERSIDEIIKYDFMNIYKKLSTNSIAQDVLLTAPQTGTLLTAQQVGG
jgi:hypothetical protein